MLLLKKKQSTGRVLYKCIAAFFCSSQLYLFHIYAFRFVAWATNNIHNATRYSVHLHATTTTTTMMMRHNFVRVCVNVAWFQWSVSGLCSYHECMYNVYGTVHVVFDIQIFWYLMLASWLVGQKTGSYFLKPSSVWCDCGSHAYELRSDESTAFGVPVCLGVELLIARALNVYHANFGMYVELCLGRCVLSCWRGVFFGKNPNEMWLPRDEPVLFVAFLIEIV